LFPTAIHALTNVTNPKYNKENKQDLIQNGNVETTVTKI